MARFNLIAALSLVALLPAAMSMPWGPWHAGPPKPPCTEPETMPTWTYPASLPTSYPTVGPTGTATGIATGTGYAYPTGSWMTERDVEDLAIEKREAFEGARKRDFPHQWPAASPAPEV